MVSDNKNDTHTFKAEATITKKTASVANTNDIKTKEGFLIVVLFCKGEAVSS